MAKKKELTIISVFKIFLDGLCLYFKNLNKFSKYMTFPVLGQLLGIVLIFTIQHLFTSNIEKIIFINPVFNNVSVVFTTLLVVTLPAFVIFLAAFWKYVVAMGALNSMANNLICAAKLEDLSIHNDTVNRRVQTFLGLLLIISLISLSAIIPLLWVPLLILMIFLSISFQIFALEENLNAIEICKKSFKIVKGNFLKTTLLLFTLYLTTYILFPEIINFAFNKFNIFNLIISPIEAYVRNLPLDEVQSLLQSAIPNLTLDITNISKKLATMTISTIVICYTLPLRSICCTLLYKDLELKKLKEKKLKEL